MASSKRSTVLAIFCSIALFGFVALISGEKPQDQYGALAQLILWIPVLIISMIVCAIGMIRYVKTRKVDVSVAGVSLGIGLVATIPLIYVLMFFVGEMTWHRHTRTVKEEYGMLTCVRAGKTKIVAPNPNYYLTTIVFETTTGTFTFQVAQGIDIQAALRNWDELTDAITKLGSEGSGNLVNVRLHIMYDTGPDWHRGRIGEQGITFQFPDPQGNRGGQSNHNEMIGNLVRESPQTNYHEVFRKQLNAKFSYVETESRHFKDDPHGGP